ncbi:uncharacterized protein LOC109612757 [Musca domestica]|uniref:Uncharacterized protein LOC109612757 n=1 Tax=Musca domestica TaxID=7370 RepID=A0A9J7DGS6_MUSDO|nr:uncharacterized protein LOC109612757 [Musca domestica]
MKYLCIILLFTCVLCNATTPLYLKRIKRNATQEQHRQQIPKDFAIVQNKKDTKEGKESAEKTSESKSLYDTVLASLTDSKTHKRDQDILNKNQSANYSKIGYSKNKSKNDDNVNIISARIVLPSEPINSDSLNPFDQMMRYANVWWYNAGLETDPAEFSQANHEDPPSPLKSGQTNMARNLNVMTSNQLRSLSRDGAYDPMGLFDNTLNEETFYCPIHHNKPILGNNRLHHLQGANAFHKDDGEGVVQVCSCHFIKNSDNKNSKDLK